MYNVSITDSTINDHQELNSLVGLLTAGKALKGLTGNLAEVVAQSTGGDSCTVTVNDSIGIAINDLTRDLVHFYARLQELSPYYDANCLRRLIMSARTAIDSELSGKVGYMRIHGIYDLVFYLKANEDDFAKGLGTALEAAYNKVTKKHYGYFSKGTYVEDVDAIDFIFSITPKDNEAALPIVREGSVRVYTKGGFKWDVSSGLYYAFNMRDEQFAIRGDSDVVAGVASNFRGELYKEENIGKGEVGFSSFLHFYPRFLPGFNVSGNIGAGVSFEEKPRIRYFSGIGFLFGKSTRIGLNLGGIFGNINELSSQYQKNASGGFEPVSFAEAGTAPAYKKRFVAKWFVSLTYNLSFIKRKSSVVQTVTNED